jgi:hypothetical protein
LKTAFEGFHYVALLGAVLAIGFGTAAAQAAPTPAQAGASKMAHIVTDELVQSPDGFSYRVVGKIYNSGEKALVDVIVTYRVWKKWQGTDGHGSAIKENGGKVLARIKYLPPRQMIDFVAVGSAPVMVSTEPDPIDAEITARFADE